MIDRHAPAHRREPPLVAAAAPEQQLPRGRLAETSGAGASGAEADPPAELAERLRVLIVDDEPPARQRLRTLLEAHGSVDVVGEAASADHARRALRGLAADLIFLDIQMPGGDGFDLVASLGAETMPEVIFVTAFDQHAIRAFEARALDYLLKPFDDQRFERALARASEAIRRRRLEGLCGRLRALLDTSTASPTPPSSLPGPASGHASPDRRATGDDDRLVIRSAGRVRLVAVEDIDWIEAAGTYVRIHTADQPLLLRQSLGRLEDRLHATGFVRIHRSTIVNTRRVRELRPLAHGEYRVVLEDGTELKLSRSYRDQLDRVFAPTA